MFNRKEKSYIIETQKVYFVENLELYKELEDELFHYRERKRFWLYLGEDEKGRDMWVCDYNREDDFPYNDKYEKILKSIIFVMNELINVSNPQNPKQQNRFEDELKKTNAIESINTLDKLFEDLKGKDIRDYKDIPEGLIEYDEEGNMAYYYSEREL